MSISTRLVLCLLAWLFAAGQAEAEPLAVAPTQPATTNEIRTAGAGNPRMLRLATIGCFMAHPQNALTGPSHRRHVVAFVR